MPDGRTPTITITGPSGAVVLTEINSAYPFARLPTNRQYEKRVTRRSATGPGKLKRRYSGRKLSENRIDMSVIYLDKSMVDKLQAVIDQDVPSCTVDTGYFASGSWDMVTFDPQPNEEDDHDENGPLYWNARMVLLRNDA